MELFAWQKFSLILLRREGRDIFIVLLSAQWSDLICANVGSNPLTASRKNYWKNLNGIDYIRKNFVLWSAQI